MPDSLCAELSAGLTLRPTASSDTVVAASEEGGGADADGPAAGAAGKGAWAALLAKAEAVVKTGGLAPGSGVESDTPERRCFQAEAAAAPSVSASVPPCRAAKGAGRAAVVASDVRAAAASVAP